MNKKKMEGDFLPFLVMAMVQLGYAGLNITSKLTMDSGMHPFVFVAYRQIFATVALVPFAYFFKRKTRPKMTISTFFEIFLCSIFGSVLFSLFQTRVSQRYEAPYSSSALMCLMGCIECVIVCFCFNHDLLARSLKPAIRIVSSVYAGIVCSALTFCAISWCIKRKGPLYVAVFNPLGLVIVAIFSWVLLEEKLYAGKVAGSIMIVSGLYAVLWGKKREMNYTNLTKEVEKDNTNKNFTTLNDTQDP
ncbi:hypothetical protein BUALT_Bualt01G0029400 [Buddleja alternifolia]|uniref:WAT1-related protein n=1 Tax=Buddleja alternifolia TaxID=168488 RepID=A0AAV6Y681_9LAMI|nr:hypothetical protein BUALT_Bualt01G0029400 [Buddleja alternifolia]